MARRSWCSLQATAVQDEIFAWDRTVSRMIEMQSEEYLINQAIDTPVNEYWEMFDLARITDEDCDRIWLRSATQKCSLLALVECLAYVRIRDFECKYVDRSRISLR